MSLFASALRIAAIESLRHRTIAGDLVVDTGADIGDCAADAPRFAIVVETGHVANQAVTLSLTLSVLVRTIVDTDVGPRVAWQMPQVTSAAGRALDLLAHQVCLALVTPDGAWGNAFAGLAGKEVMRTMQQRPVDPGLPMRVLSLEVTMVKPPLTRKSAENGWARFFEELDGMAPDTMAAERALFDAAFAGPEMAIDWAAIGLANVLSAAEAAELVAAATPPAVEPAVAAPAKKRARKPRSSSTPPREPVAA